ncbi:MULTISPECIES: DUF4350 domain-containing protein [Auritidibacter]|uniref:DUF4350 domain-containing protein n=1 Tax=Auritidibacter TaxID=1160973 RepID=UPI000D73423C|nr:MULTISPECIES: DUF4350 domain-containing protein [Auritidibacter]NIH71619.1 hypothetical protein [Auritidibacter ignavus]PXA81921.1 hypothetical protein DCC25_00615 [Auritidibacter sp. NML120636]RMX24232.1 DUF4350 domain-containing protein [Auritidibacter ignavus]WHS35249.1 DUF4350 domain-containing protein [Auritidibacter ignavus]
MTAASSLQSSARTSQTGSRKTGIIVVSVIAGILVLAGVVFYALLPSTTQGIPYSTDNPGRYGSQAMTRILEDRGVSVHTAATVDQLEGQLNQHPDATVVLIDENNNLASAPHDSRQRAAEAIPPSQLVISTSSPELLEHFTDEFSRDYATVSSHDGGITAGTTEDCQLKHGRVAGEIDSSSWAVSVPRTQRESGQISTCFPVPENASSDQATALLAETATGITVLTSPKIFTNERIDERGNAALALRLAGSREDLIWYTPDFTELLDSDAPLSEAQLPRFVVFGIWWAVVLAVLAMFWLGRRHGPIVREPLPSVVKPAETTVGRARMHRRAGHHLQALEALEQATLRRIAHSMRLGRNTDPQTIMRQAALHTNQPVQDIQQLFKISSGLVPAHGSHNVSPEEMVTTAQELTDFEHLIDQVLRPDHGRSTS